MKPLRTLGTLAVTAAAAVGMASSASAAPTGIHAEFKHCPYTNVNVSQCINSVINGGEIKLGNSAVPIPSSKKIVLQGGVIQDGTTSTWVDAVGADTLSKTPLDVPGGLISTVSSNWFFGPLLDAFNWAISFANGVTATAEKAGPVQFSFGNLLFASGTAIELPVRVKLNNAFLGNNCYVGTTANPVRFRLTTGTTTQAPTLTGSPGTLGFSDDFSVTYVSGLSLVDSAFTAPKAENCGSTVLDRWLVTLAVNAKIGLPATAGQSRAIMNGKASVGGADAVRASAGL
ncbi:MAG: hypothetical protein WC558_13325 [Patulibacter sp.]